MGMHCNAMSIYPLHQVIHLHITWSDTIGRYPPAKGEGSLCMPWFRPKSSHAAIRRNLATRVSHLASEPFSLIG